MATGYWSRLCRGSSILLLSGLLATGIYFLTGCDGSLIEPRLPEIGYILPHVVNEVTGETIQDADVFVNGTKRALSDILIKVVSGTHEIYASKNGYESSPTQTVYVPKDDTVKITLTLMPLTGALYIESNPEAKILMNNTDTNMMTPQTLDLPGTREGLLYRISLVIEGYARFDTTVAVKPGTRSEIRATLRKLVGSLAVNSIPIGAPIYLDGKNTDHVTPYEFTDLMPKKYEVMFKHPEREVFIDTVEVKAFEKTKVDTALVRCRTLLRGSAGGSVASGIAKGPSPTSTCKFDWQLIPDTPATVGLLVIGDTIVAYTSQGLQISYDNMKKWQSIPQCPVLSDVAGAFFTAVPIASISGKPLEGYLGLGGNLEMLYRFTPESCVPLGNRLPNIFQRNYGIQGVLVNPENPPEAWFVGDGGILHTIDKGQTINIAFQHKDVFLTDIVNDPFNSSRIYAVGWIGDEKKITALSLRSDDKGNTWQKFFDGLPGVEFRNVVADPQHRDHLYATSGVRREWGGIWESTDAGENWKSVSRSDFLPYDLLIDYPFIISPSWAAKIGEHIWRLFPGCCSGFGFAFVIELQK